MKNDALILHRKQKGLTQAELGAALKYSKATVSNWENGYSTPSLSDAFKIADLLDTDVNVIFSGLKVQETCTFEVG